ncbi:hypothetical protein G7Y89_g7039 [Cudoniella acicularis]|uniref:SH3 domain-containing protein n=1 Tax=Cudoniella acicularis TaxID=354080 RepID=A0A8H4RKV0_9HELO|nr:hypothetical protein G7Y89_g7039 [Cudoniella acicularis]
MAEIIKNVILIGGSGNIGASILTALLSSPQFHTTILTRTASTKTFAPSLNVIKSDYSQSSLISAFTGQDAVVCALGAEGFKDEIKIIDAAVKAGVKRFLPSEYGSNTLNAKTQALVPFFKMKGEVIEYLKEKEEKGLSWTAIPAGPAFDWGLQFGLIGFDITKHSAIIFDGGNRPFSTSNLSQIGNSVVAALSKPAETRNKYLCIHSFTVTQNQILAALEKATGKKWDVTTSTTEAAEREGKELFGKGDYNGLLLLLKVNMLGEGFKNQVTFDAFRRHQQPPCRIIDSYHMEYKALSSLHSEANGPPTLLTEISGCIVNTLCYYSCPVVEIIFCEAEADGTYGVEEIEDFEGLERKNGLPMPKPAPNVVGIRLSHEDPCIVAPVSIKSKEAPVDLTAIRAMLIDELFLLLSTLGQRILALEVIDQSVLPAGRNAVRQALYMELHLLRDSFDELEADIVWGAIGSGKKVAEDAWMDMTSVLEEKGFPQPMDKLLPRVTTWWFPFARLGGARLYVNYGHERNFDAQQDAGRYLYAWTIGNGLNLYPGDVMMICESSEGYLAQWLEGLHGVKIRCLWDRELDWSSIRYSEKTRKFWKAATGNGLGLTDKLPSYIICDPKLQQSMPFLKKFESSYTQPSSATQQKFHRRPPPAAPAPPAYYRHVKEKFSFKSESEEELEFAANDVLEILDDSSQDGW